MEQGAIDLVYHFFSVFQKQDHPVGVAAELFFIGKTP